MLPGQKFIMKLYYKIPLETVEKTMIIRDKFNDRELYHFTEKEYLEYLYSEGRCNIKYIDDKPRNELVLIIGRRGTKCNLFSSPITTTAGTINYSELKDRLDKKEKIGIYTYDPHTFKKYITYDIRAEDNGIKDTVRITTKYGRIDEVTANHPYFVWRDDWDKPQWVESKDLIIGDRLAISKSLEIFGKESIGESKAKILGYLLSDCGLTSGIKSVNMNSKFIEDFQNCLTSDFKHHLIKPITGAKYGYNVISSNKKETNGKNKVKEWLSSIGEYGKLAKNKRIPDCIKKSPKNEISIFLNRLYACDGCVFIDSANKNKRKNPKTSIKITLASKEFILDIQKELIKFGIFSTWNYAVAKLDGKKFDSWVLSIAQKDSIIKFSKEIGILGNEGKLAQAARLSKEKLDQDDPLDLLPMGAWNRILNIKKERNLSNADILGKHGLDHHERLKPDYKLSKEKAIIYSKNIDDLYLYNLANSEICWDTVASLDDLGKQNTVALEVKGTNIIGNDIISHNSTISSWIAAYETYKLLKTYHPQKYYRVLPDSEISITCVATSEDQSNLLFRQILGHFALSTYFHRYMLKPTSDRVYIRSRRDLEKYGEEGKASLIVRSAACSARGLRGAGNILVIMDEQAHFVDIKTRSNKSDKAVYDAITPSVAQFGSDGKIINISSPLNKSGMLWDLYNSALTGAENILMIQAPSWEINTTLDTAYLKGRYHTDPVTYECEFGGNFSDRVKAWLPEEYLRRVIEPGLKEKSVGLPRTPYFVGLDVGFKKDATAIAVSHVERVEDEKGNPVDKIELDYVDTRQAGVYPYEDYDILDFELISDWIKDVCSRFPAVKGLIDQHNGVLVGQNLSKKGMNQFELIYHTRNFNSQLYQNFMMLCIDKKLRLYNDKTAEGGDSLLIEELLKLQVQHYSKNIIAVSAPNLKGHHDDRSDAIMRSIWLASEAIRTGMVSGSSRSRPALHIPASNATQYRMRKQRYHNITDNRRNPRANKNSWRK